MEIDLDSLVFRLCDVVDKSSSDPNTDMKDVLQYLQDEPCLIPFNLSPNYPKWVMIVYIPDTAAVRSKMIYASALGNLKSTLGTPHFLQDFFISSKNECTYANYASKFDEALKNVTMSQTENDMKQEIRDAFPQDSQSNAMAMLNLNMLPSAIDAFGAMSEMKGNGLILNIDFGGGKESLNCKTSGSFGSLDEIKEQIEPDVPCYILYRYNHVDPHRSIDVSKLVFFYYCPDNAPAKLKMTYSIMCKNIVAACKALNLPVAKQFEPTTLEEIEESEIIIALYPVQDKPVDEIEFHKPKGPRRGKN